jgi:HSP20 family molecular chaperone IbpA
MSLYGFPGLTTSSADTSFHPLFRLLDDFDQYSQANNTGRRHNRGSVMKTFQPKFDVKETGPNYELHGELPGVEQKDVEIEFTDDHTILIKGRTERSYQSGTPPAGFVEGPASTSAITEGGEHHENGHYHKPTVEDADTAVATKESGSTEVAKKDTKKEPEQPAHKFWVSERSVGEFSRSFTFPVRVDQDAVKASMKNGVLSIVVPKAQKKEGRKITIN